MTIKLLFWQKPQSAICNILLTLLLSIQILCRMTIATHFQKYFSISATKLITELKTKNSRKKREHGPWPSLIPIPPSSRRITLTYEVMIFVFSAQFFLLPPSKITLTYEVMMAARLLCPDPNVPDVRSVRKCPPTPPGLPSGVRNIHKCPATISSVPNRVRC